MLKYNSQANVSALFTFIHKPEKWASPVHLKLEYKKPNCFNPLFSHSL